MTAPRPKHPKRDGNDKFITPFLTRLNYQYMGIPLFVWDTSPLGGETTDRILWFGALGIALEIKTPGQEKRFTDGEKAFIRRNIAIVEIVTDEYEFLNVLEKWYPLAKEVDKWLKR